MNGLSTHFQMPDMSHIWEPDYQYDVYQQVANLACEMLVSLGELSQESLADLLEKDQDVKPSLFKPLTHQARDIHPGLSDSDLWDTTLSVLMMRSTDLLMEDLKKLAETLKEKAFEHKFSFMVSRIHGAHAQPTTFGLKMANWFKSTERCLERIRRAQSVIGYGTLAGSVGSFAHLNPHVEENVCRKLGLKPDSAANQLIQRDRHTEYLTMLALVASTFGQLCAEIYQLQRTDIQEVREYHAAEKDAFLFAEYPLVVEQLRDLCNIITNHAFSLMVDVSPWSERDLSNTRIKNMVIAESCVLLDYVLQKFNKLIEELIVNEIRMKSNIQKTQGLIFVEDILGLLVRKGVSSHQAHAMIAEHVVRCREEDEDLIESLLKDTVFTQQISKEELQQLVSFEEQLKHIDFIFNSVFTNE